MVFRMVRELADKFSSQINGRYVYIKKDKSKKEKKSSFQLQEDTLSYKLTETFKQLLL